MYPDRLLVLVFVLFSAVVSKAESPICQTLDECVQLRDKIEKRISYLESIPDLRLDLLYRFPRAYTQREMMTQEEAVAFCSEHGARLPTLREFTEAFQALGAYKEYSKWCSQENRYCFDLNVTNSDGSIEKFEFTRHGWEMYSTASPRAMHPEIVDPWFWTDSKGVSSERPLMADVLYADIRSADRHYKANVLCIEESKASLLIVKGNL